MGGKKYSMDKSLTSGSMGMMLLKLLSEKDMYGYEHYGSVHRMFLN